MKLSDYYKEENYIHYSNCHEDFLLLKKYMKESYRQVLSVASGLDNSLAFLTWDNVKVFAFDYNPSQVYLGLLKVEGIRRLDREEFLVFLGITGTDPQERIRLYDSIKPHIPQEAAAYFDSHLFLIEEGLVNCGRFEQYFHIFRNRVFPAVCADRHIRRFAQARDMEEQVRIYRRRINTIRFRLMFRIFFSQKMMGRLGRDKAFFKYSRDNLPKILKHRVDTGFHNSLNRTNPYYSYVLTTGYTREALPFYLEEENYSRIRENIGNISIERKTFDQMLDKKYDFMNLSDIFEYMDNGRMEHCSQAVREHLNEGGRAAFWNMMNVRELCGMDRINGMEDWLSDRAFFYRDYLVYEK